MKAAGFRDSSIPDHPGCAEGAASPPFAHIALILFSLCLFTACGKVGPPLPPIKRVVPPVGDLSVSQDGNRIVLTWTNPATYVDGNPVTDLSTIRILRDGSEVATVMPGPPGARQSYAVDAGEARSQEHVYSVQVELRGGRSAVSNAAAITPMETPGPVRDLRALVDEFSVRLRWEPPETNAELVRSYVVRRADGASATVTGTQYEEMVELGPDKSYVYTVTPVRGENPGVPGTTSEAVRVEAVDKTPPSPPMGLTIDRASAAVGIGLLSWTQNAQADLLGYKVYRAEMPDQAWELRTPTPIAASAFSDANYRSGFYYRVTAVDVFGNESSPSMVLQGP